MKELNVKLKKEITLQDLNSIKLPDSVKLIKFLENMT